MDASAPDVAAFSAWYRETYPRVFGYLLRRTGDVAAAEDLASEVFTIAWTAGERSRAHPGWVFVTARNVVSNSWRAQARFAELHQELSAQISTGVVPGFVPPPGHDDPAVLSLREAMAQLPREQQELLVARYWDELSGVECAELFGCTHAAVRIRLHHAKRALAALCRAPSNPDREEES